MMVHFHAFADLHPPTLSECEINFGTVSKYALASSHCVNNLIGIQLLESRGMNSGLPFFSGKCVAFENHIPQRELFRKVASTL